MSLAAMHWARQSLKTLPDKVRAPARLALMLLADYADEQHASWPSVSTMALEMGCSVRSVQRAIDLLEQHGLLKVENRLAKNGRQISNRYHLAVDGLHPVGRQSDTLSMSDEIGEGDNLTPPEGVNLTGEGDTGDRGRVSPVSPLDSTNRTLPLTPSHSGERDSHFPPNVFERAAQQTDDGQPLETQHRRYPMTLDWVPDEGDLAVACLRAGLAQNIKPTPAQLAKFTAHHADTGRAHGTTAWLAKLVDWLRNDLRNATPNPTGGPAHGHRRERTPARRLTAAEARQRDRERQHAEQPGGCVYDAQRDG